MQRYFGNYGLFLLLIPFVIAGAAMVALAGVAGPSYRPLSAVPGGDPAQGPQSIVNYGCGSCHQIPGVAGANGHVGPSLAGIAERSFLAGALPNNPDNLILWIQHPQQVIPGNAMPELGVSEPAARDIAAYLYTLR